MSLLAAIAFGLQAAYWMLLRTGFRRAMAQGGGRNAGDMHTAFRPAPMSVVVAARDEAENIPQLLQALRRQDHPAYEVVVVDDGSTDGTEDILGDWSRRFDRLRICRTEGVGKKRALTAGIEVARFDLLAFTDADCAPPPGWLSGLAAEHAVSTRPRVLVGYSPFAPSGGFAGRLARYETFVTGFLTAAAAGLDRPYMAVGRNISYPRSVFTDVGGFEPIMHSLSGDDDLFVQEVARRGAADVRVILSPATFVSSAAPSSFGEWIRQKRRHASAGRFYGRSVQAHLAAFHGSNLLLWLAPLYAGWVGAGLLGVKLALQFGVLRAAAEPLREAELMRMQPLLEPAYLLYNVLIAPIGLIRMPKRW